MQTCHSQFSIQLREKKKEMREPEREIPVKPASSRSFLFSLFFPVSSKGDPQLQNSPFLGYGRSLFHSVSHLYLCCFSVFLFSELPKGSSPHIFLEAPSSKISFFYFFFFFELSASPSPLLFYFLELPEGSSFISVPPDI